MSDDAEKVTIDLRTLRLVRSAFDIHTPEGKDRLRAVLGEVEELGARAKAMRDWGLDDLALAEMVGEASRSVYLTLLEPDPSKRSRRWHAEYEARVVSRLVSLLAIHLYVDTHRPWSATDNLLLGPASKTLAELALPASDGRSIDAVIAHLRGQPITAAIAEYVALSPHQRDATSGFDTTLSALDVPTTDGALSEQLLDGLYPARPVEGVIVQEWRHYALRDDGAYLQPSVRVTLGDGGALASIEVGFDGAPGDFPHRAAPTDGDAWEIAKHCVRVSNLLEGQLRGHLGRGHVVTETYRSALDRVRGGQNPLWRVLRPFLLFVREIDNLGDPLIFGEGSIIQKCGALTPEGVAQVLSEVLDDERWDRWTPPHEADPRREGPYGRASAAFAAGLDTFVEMQIDAHADAIRAHWGEIDTFIEALGEARERPADRPWSAAPTGPLAAGDLDGLRKMVMHAIFHASFFHTWSNDRQWLHAGDPAKTAFAVRARIDGASSYEQWRARAAPEPADRWLQMTLADVLSHTRYGRLEEIRAHGDEYRDVLGDEDRAVLDALHQHLSMSITDGSFPLDRLRPFVAI